MINEKGVLKLHIKVKDAGTKPLSKGCHAYVTIEDTQRDELKLKSGYFSRWFEGQDRALEYIYDLNEGDSVDLEYEVKGDFLNIIHLTKVGSADGDVVDAATAKAEPPKKPVEATDEQVGRKLREEALLLPNGYLVRVLGHYHEAIKVSMELSGGDKDVQLVLLDKIARPVNYLLTDMARREHDGKKSEGEVGGRTG